MSDFYLGEIRAFGFNFPPVSWLQCQGQTLAINSNQALFALLGTMYGGNGTTNFMLPDLRGRSAIGMGQGAGLPSYNPGQVGGAETATVGITNLPAHTHAATFTSGGGGTSPTVNVTVQAGNGAAVSPAPTTAPYLTGMSSVPHGGVASGLFASSAGTAPVPLGGVSATISGGSTGSGTVTNALTGSGTPLNIQNPYLCINYCISTAGIFPSRQ